MSESDLSQLSPKEVLFSYFADRLVLNRDAMIESANAQQASRDMDLVTLRDRQSAIREKHCTKRRRKTDPIFGYGILDEQANDAANITIEKEVQKGKEGVVFYLYNMALKEHFRYFLIFQKGHWRIDKVEYKNRKLKWVSGSL